MNTSLQIALAKNHQQELQRRGIEAEHTLEVQSYRTGSFTSTARSAWVGARSVATRLAQRVALASGEPTAVAPRVRW